VSGQETKGEAFTPGGQVRRLVVVAFGKDMALRVTRGGEK
jgi:hypothetical protein